MSDTHIGKPYVRKRQKRFRYNTKAKNKVKSKLRTWYIYRTADEDQLESVATKLYNTMKRCSCMACSNRRKWDGESRREKEVGIYEQRWEEEEGVFR